MWLTHHQLRYHRTRFRVEAPSRPPSSRDCDTMGGIRSAAHAREARGSGEGRRGMGGERGEWEGGVRFIKTYFIITKQWLKKRDLRGYF